jgi:hypothetical protein
MRCTIIEFGLQCFSPLLRTCMQLIQICQMHRISKLKSHVNSPRHSFHERYTLQIHPSLFELEFLLDLESERSNSYYRGRASKKTRSFIVDFKWRPAARTILLHMPLRMATVRLEARVHNRASSPDPRPHADQASSATYKALDDAKLYCLQWVPRGTHEWHKWANLAGVDYLFLYLRMYPILNIIYGSIVTDRCWWHPSKQEIISS